MGQHELRGYNALCNVYETGCCSSMAQAGALSSLASAHANASFGFEHDSTQSLRRCTSIVKVGAQKRRTTCLLKDASWKPAPMGEISSYNDSWVDKHLLNVFVQAISRATGKSTELDGFNAFVDIARKVVPGRTPAQQHQVIGQVLHSILPPWVGKIFRILPPSKVTAEFFAFSTTICSSWLIGPSKVIEVEVNGVKQRSGVHIHKCRFLENAKCIGMCVNLCKIPSQNFIKEELGIPFTMVPNFEDMSCEFIYGQLPPPLEEDPVSKQGCYHGLCPTAQKLSSCPKVVNEE